MTLQTLARTLTIAIGFGLVLPAHAQTAPGFTTIPVTFTGTVSNDPGQTIRIQVPGSVTPVGQPVPTVPYTGPLPDFPLIAGDTIQFSYNVTVPTGAYLASSAYTGQVAADGIYKLNVVSAPPRDINGNVAALGTYALSSGPSLSAPFFNPTTTGQPSVGGYTIVYDAKADSYSLSFPSAIAGTAGWDAPTYNYDYATNRVGVVDSSCFVGISCSSLNFRGSYGFQIGESGGYSTTGVLGTTTTMAPVVGFFDILFGGSWSLPTWKGGATQVPEPGTTLLFGAAFAALAERRRRAIAARPA
ncbi:PEP-CTERM sorting domain-containing protein [Novosphingobium sp. MMS21-SN21R]|uniref:PEP-CTERM sorting domain-containing protein n=1 Tax=Novosphingobium sp. MMS21-SN21R TaxID=2969298 RepID=UPI0028866BFE|nr:PEP-CTERM sorting domain-containing protein [Novosphingobium sp. MMS21-SN21R]MDT0506896.1 PEP-CTERM sorting domain-containing protein [Novosphingobium sp. MMS21-SN21R]